MSYNKGIVATLPELEQFYKGKKAGDIIELMNQTNDIITDIPFMESNHSDGHLTRIRTGLPEVYCAGSIRARRRPRRSSARSRKSAACLRP